MQRRRPSWWKARDCIDCGGRFMVRVIRGHVESTQVRCQRCGDLARIDAVYRECKGWARR